MDLVSYMVKSKEEEQYPATMDEWDNAQDLAPFNKILFGKQQWYPKVGKSDELFMVCKLNCNYGILKRQGMEMGVRSAIN